MNSFVFQNESRLRISVTILLIVLVAVGFWLRFRNLGTLGLMGDEGNQVMAVQGILKYGIPKVESGLIYPRGILYLYSEAAAALMFGLNEFSLRLPSVLFGAASILSVYYLGNAVFTRSIGLMAAFVMTFSVWEIEMSRYARFYAPFQFMYIVSLLCFYRGFMLGERSYKFWFFVSAFISISFQDLGVMLTTCFLIPIISGTDTSPRRRWAMGFSAVGLAALWAIYPKLLRLLNVYADPISLSHGPPVELNAFGQIKAVIKHRFYTPNIYFLIHLPKEHFGVFLVLASVAGGATVYLLYRFFRKKEGWRPLLGLPMIGAAFGHQFGLVLTLALIYLTLFARNWRSLADPVLKTVYAVSAVCFVFWIPVLAGSPEREISVARVMFDYPRVYYYFLDWYLRGWPVMSGFIGIGCAILAFRFISDRRSSAPFFALGTIFIPVIITGFLRTEFYEARYTFHLYPMMVIVFAMVAIEGSNWITSRLTGGGGVRTAITAGLLAVALLVSQDANPVSAWQIGSRTYRSKVDPIRGIENWRFYASFRQDQRTPGLYVRGHVRPGDIVMAAGAPHMIAVYDYYAGRVDYSVTEAVEGYQMRLEDGTLRDHVTGSQMLNTLAKIKHVVESDAQNGIWFLCDRALLLDENHYFSDPVKEYLRSLSVRPDILGMDGKTFAVKLK